MLTSFYNSSSINPSLINKQYLPEGSVLPEDEIHIWTVDLDHLASDLPRLALLLTADEAARADRLRSKLVRQRFTTARATLRIILSQYVGCPPTQVLLGRGVYGKPYLRFPQAKLEFNLSHSGGRALVAAADGIPLGIDLEAIRPVDEMETIITNYFTPAEREQIQGLPAMLKPEGFFNAWTRKEAYVKGRGSGFSLRFSVSLVPGKPARLLDDGEKKPGSDGWRLANISLAAGEGYSAALAYQSRHSCRMVFKSV